MENTSLAECHPIPNKVKVNLHMSQHAVRHRVVLTLSTGV
jgi:hypothetical protein